MPKLLRDRRHPLARRGKDVAVSGLWGRAHARRRPVVAEHVTQHPGPLAGRGTRLRRLDGRRHDVGALVGCGLGQLLERRLDLVGVALGLPALECLAALALDLRVGGEDPTVGAGRERRILGLGEGVLADDLDLTALDLRNTLAVGLDKLRLHIGDGLNGAAVLLHRQHLLARPLGELVR